MIIYNSREMETKYMAKDEVVVEIHSMLSLEELLTKLRAGEEISPDEAVISAFSVGDGSVITQAENTTGEEMSATYGYNTFLNEERLEELEEAAEDNGRPKLFQAFEAFQFNRAWRNFEFQSCELTREQLATQLYAVLGIMPTIKDIPEKNITELKRMSSAGDRLYWSFTEIAHNNKLPSRADIEFYESLGDYEKRIINESGVHPMKMLDIARGIKEGDPGRLLTTLDEQRAHVNDAETVIALAKTPGVVINLSKRINGFNTKRDLAFNAWVNAEKPQVPFGQEMTEIESAFYNELASIADCTGTLSEIRLEFNQKIANAQNDNERQKVEEQKKKTERAFFTKEMFEARVFSQEALDIYANGTTARGKEDFVKKLFSDYEKMFEDEFFPKHITETQLPNYDESAIHLFADEMYKEPIPKCLRKAEEVFKELFHGHAPRVLSEYMYGQFFAKGIKPHDATETQIREIAGAFDQKNVSKVAKYKNLVLFALADKLNFNEVKIEHLQAFASFIKPEDLKQLFDKGFVEWYKANKDTNLSNLVEMLGMYNRIGRFDPAKSAKDHVADIVNARGRADCEQMERRYGYHFRDNEIAIRGRHTVAQEGKIKMYMLPVDDYRNFTVGYDTNCCQHYGSAGEACVWKLTTDPFAACVVIERDGNILAQGYVWTDEAQDTLVFDNVEFADDRKVGQFNNLFAAWARAMPYKNIHVGIGYNQGMHSWGKKVTFQAVLPTTLNERKGYSDYHSDARALKTNGAMQIQEKIPVKVVTKPDEPTRWDVLARPETAFLLNDCHSSIESRLEFARNFLNEQTPEVQMEAVRRNILAIKYIENPTEEVQTYVIERDPKLATMISNPCVSVQRILIDIDPAYIRNIQNPDEEMQIKAVTHNGLLLGDIENPSEVVKRIAVEQNGYAIRFISHPNETLQAAAVRSNPKVISLLRNATEDIQRMAVDADPSVVGLIERPSETLQLFAVEKNPYVINSIKNPEYNAVKRAVEKEGLLIRNFQFEYPHLRIAALNQNGFVIRALKNPTDEEYVAAVRQNRAVANIIRDPELKANVLAVVDGHAQLNENDYEMEEL